MPHLLYVWPRVSQLLRQAGRVLLLFDYDGTLTPIVDHPDLAVLAPGTKALLAGLSRDGRFILGIISGRSLDDVRARVGVSGLVYAGNHGLEIQGPGLDFTHPCGGGVAGDSGPGLRPAAGGIWGMHPESSWRTKA